MAKAIAAGYRRRNWIDTCGCINGVFYRSDW